MTSTKGARPRASAIVKADPGHSIVHLTKEERRVFEAALRMGEDLATDVESKVSAYGRWLLETVFDDDAKAALDEKSENPVWLELTRRAGGPSLPLSRRMLYVALQLAARDKRISDLAWRRLDAGRKELLLPLSDDKRLRDAAHHVTSFNLSQSKTRVYVATLLAEGGKSRQVRLTAKSLSSRIRKVRELLDGAAVLRRVRGLTKEIAPGDRQQIVGEIEKLREVLLALSREVRAK